MDNRTVDHGTMGQWGNGTLGHWDSGTGRAGQGDNAQWDNEIWGTGKKEQWDNGILDNGTVDK
jgi:hypothetical protein